MSEPLAIPEHPVNELIARLRVENAKLKAEKADDELAFNLANKTVGKLEADLAELIERVARAEAELAALRAQVERMSAPVSIYECLKYGIWQGMKISVDALIAERSKP